MSENCPWCGAPFSSIIGNDVYYQCHTTHKRAGDKLQSQSAECKIREPLHKRNVELEGQLDERTVEIAGYAASLDDQDKLRRKAEGEVERLKGRLKRREYSLTTPADPPHRVHVEDALDAQKDRDASSI